MSHNGSFVLHLCICRFLLLLLLEMGGLQSFSIVRLQFIQNQERDISNFWPAIVASWVGLPCKYGFSLHPFSGHGLQMIVTSFDHFGMGLEFDRFLN